MDINQQNPSQEYFPQTQVPSNLTPYTLQKMKETATWMKVVSVILFILTALIFFLALFILSEGGKMKSVSLRGVPSVIAIVYIILGIIFYLIPGILLMVHASKLTSFSITNSISDFEDAIAKGKSFWTYIGIVTLIVIVIFFIAVIISIAAAS